MSSKKLTFIFGGDTSVGDDSAKYFQGVAPMLKAADVRMAQLETPYAKEISEYASASRNLKVLEPMVGLFDLMTLSGNHFYDLGEGGVKDTIEWLDSKGIAHAGGGSNLAEAKQPAFFEKDGVKFGVLAYNAVGPKSSFAGPDKGGDAFVNFTRGHIPVDEDVSRHECDNYDFKKPVHIDGDFNRDNFADPTSLLSMADDIAALRPLCDVLVVYYHKGKVHRPADVSDLERLMCHMAIDAGADIVFATHSHLLRGCEIYKGRTIYHGLNNFVMWVPGLSPFYKGKRDKDMASANGEEWVQKRVERFGFIPDIEYPTYPFHPDSKYTAAAKCIVEDGKITETKFVPILVNKEGVSNVVGPENGGQAVFDYIVSITEQAGLNVRYEWDGDDIRIIEK